MTGIPRQLSVDEAAINGLIPLKICVDGVTIDSVIRYDMDAGEVEHFISDGECGYVRSGDEFATIVTRGTVTVERITE